MKKSHVQGQLPGGDRFPVNLFRSDQLGDIPHLTAEPPLEMEKIDDDLKNKSIRHSLFHSVNIM